MKTFVAVFALICASVHAESIELTNAEAQKLWTALNQIPEGFTYAVIAADDATALLPKVQAFENAVKAKMREQKVTQGMINNGVDSDAVRTVINYSDEISEQKITVDLDRFEVTAAEIPKLRVAVLAVIRQFLKPNPAKKP